MSDGTKIEWTDSTWNVITGCSVVSAGCKHCYAMKLAGTRLQHHPSRAGLTHDTKNGPVWTGEVRFNEQWLDQPLRWSKPRMVFVCAHADLFHHNVPDEWIDKVFAVMALAKQHSFQVLTKRPERMREYLSNPDRKHIINGTIWSMLGMGPARKIKHGGNWRAQLPMPNVWLGVSVEDQAAADERIPLLLQTPAAVRWISAEPLLGPVELPFFGTLPYDISARYALGYEFIDWVVVGGESGPNARPMHQDWARSLRDQCADAGVPFLFKQWGEWAPGENCGPILQTQKTADYFAGKWSFGSMTPKQSEECHIDDEPTLYWCGKKAAGRLLDGVQHDGYPEGGAA